MEWEEVLRIGVDVTSRLKIHGGWLVRQTGMSQDGQGMLALAFVPDPNHDWQLPSD
mgnify:CR=1 FL=1